MQPTSGAGEKFKHEAEIMGRNKKQKVKSSYVVMFVMYESS